MNGTIYLIFRVNYNHSYITMVILRSAFRSL